MKKKIFKSFLYVIISFALIIGVGCNSTEVLENKKITQENTNIIQEEQKASYQIYGLSGMNVYSTKIFIGEDQIINSDEPKKLEAASIGYLSAIRELPNKSILSAFYGIKEEEGYKMHVIDNNEFVSYDVFDEVKISANAIVDSERNLAYFMGETQDKELTPLGTAIDVVDLSNNKVIDRLYFKGELYGCTMNDSYIYLSILLGQTYGYEEVEEAYIARINKETREYEIVTKEGLDYGPIDVLATEDNNIYAISCINPRKNGGVNEPKISKYNEFGELQGEFEIPLWCDKMLLDDDGLIYINHIGRESMGDYEGQSITVFDTKKDEIIGTIEGFEGCASIDIKDDYLFVANYLTGDVSIIEKGSRKQIGSISLEDKGRLREIIVVKE